MTYQMDFAEALECLRAPFVLEDAYVEATMTVLGMMTENQQALYRSLPFEHKATCIRAYAEKIAKEQKTVA